MSFRKKTTKIKLNENDNRAMSKVMSIGLILCGSLLCIPFLLNGFDHHYLGYYGVLCIFAFIVGSPMIMAGFIGVITNGNTRGRDMSSELDSSRIRYAVEKEVLYDKKNN